MVPGQCNRRLTSGKRDVQGRGSWQGPLQLHCCPLPPLVSPPPVLPLQRARPLQGVHTLVSDSLSLHLLRAPLRTCSDRRSQTVYKYLYER